MHRTVGIIRKFPFTLALVAGIIVICMIPIPDIPLGEVSMIDKWTHIVMYLVLELVLLVELRRSGLRPGAWEFVALAFVAPLALGGLIELMQAYLTTCRSGDPLDFLADAIGTAIGLPAWIPLRRRKA